MTHISATITIPRENGESVTLSADLSGLEFWQYSEAIKDLLNASLTTVNAINEENKEYKAIREAVTA